MATPVRRIDTLLREAAATGDIPTIRELLSLCDDIYYSHKPHRYNGVTYGFNDLPDDKVYDAFRKEFTPDVNPTDLFKRAGPVGEDVLIPHEYPMGSLKKYDGPDVKNLHTVFLRLGTSPSALIATLKADGVSMQTTFVNGEMVKAVTRYDHKMGRSVLPVALHFATRPDPSFAGKIIVAGEVVLKEDMHKRLGFAHPRNGAAGILNRKNVTDAQYLFHVIFDLCVYEPSPSDVEAGWPKEKPSLITDQFALAGKLGFECVPFVLIGLADLNEKRLQAIYEGLKVSVPYIADGIVICPNAWTAETTDPPKMKVAYKGPTDGEWSTVLAVVPRATRTGNVIPQVYVEPVVVSGSRITTIAGGNYRIIIEKGVKIGSHVLVVKAKEVIPFIQEVEDTGVETLPIKVPTQCPACSSPVVEVDRMLKCPNPACPAKMVGQVQVFIDTIGVKGIGKKRLEKLNVDSIAELYGMSVTDIAAIEGFAAKTAQSIYDQLRSCINPIGEATLLAAIGPPLIRGRTAELIASHISIEEIFGDTPIPETRLTAIKGVGPEKARQLTQFYQAGREILQVLRANGLRIEKGQSLPSVPTATGKVEVICLTGRGPKTRAEYEAAIARKGWRSVSAVSRSVTFLVASDPNSSTAKVTAAKKFGIPIISYEELNRMLGL